MVYFRNIKPTQHYLEEHEKEVPWEKVVELIFSTKNPKKNGNVFEIESKKYYILFRVTDETLFIINAKLKK
tara:strand:- start:9 stop:221 length:213 start_codon:yes stop_codon:yes gene_type:complete